MNEVCTTFSVVKWRKVHRHFQSNVLKLSFLHFTVRWSSQGGPLHTPLGSVNWLENIRKIYPFKGSTMPTFNICVVSALERKIRYGAEPHCLVTPTFFLWEIIQKFFFLSLSFHIPVTLNNNFSPSCRVPMGPWGPF